MDFHRAFDPRRSLLIVGTLLTAFAVGHFMQSGAFGRLASGDGAAAAHQAVWADTPTLPGPPTALLSTFEMPPALPLPDNGIKRAGTTQVPDDAGYSAYGLSCETDFHLEPKAAAMVAMTISSPCRPLAALRIEHGMLTFDATTDAYGRLMMKVPALDYSAEITASFEDGLRLHQATRVEDFADYRRVALTTSEPEALRIRAIEPGTRSASVHVWAEAPGSAHRALSRQGGFLTRLGAREMVEVYTFPALGPGQGGVVRLSVEAAVTDRTCGRTVTGKTIQAGAVGGPMVRAVEVTLPGCDAVGRIVQVESALRDMRLVRR